MKFTLQAPYLLVAIGVFFLTGALVNQMTGNANTGLLVACVASFVVWRMGHDKAQVHESQLDDPPARLFAVSDFDVMAALKEAMSNNIGDKWWTQKSFDDAPDEEGHMKAKYVMTYEEEFKSTPPMVLKRQLILDVTVGKVASQTSVKLTYQVASEKMRWTANEILEQTTAMIWGRLDRLVAVKTAKGAGGQ